MLALSMNELTTFRWTFDEDVVRYKAAGFDAMGVWRQKLADFGEEKGIELLHESEMNVSNLMWIGGFTGSDGGTFRDSLEDATEAIELAAAMQAGALVCYSGARGGHTYNHARRLLVSALRELEPLARNLGVTLAVEPMHPGCADTWTFLTSLDDTLDVLAEINSPFVKMVFDTYHLGYEENENIVARCREIASQVAVVHLGDAVCPPAGEPNRCLPGRGELPLAEMLAALTEGGYQGYADIELIGEQMEGISYEDILAKSAATSDRLATSAVVQ